MSERQNGFLVAYFRESTVTEAPHVFPSRMNSPDVGTSKQPIMFMRVDLPEPEGPMMATILPDRW